MVGVDRISAACSECRKHKIRCHPAPDDPQHLLRCERCAKFDLDCQFLKHKRGRKPKNQTGDGTRTADPSSSRHPVQDLYADSPVFHSDTSPRSAYYDEPDRRQDDSARLPRFAFMGYSDDAPGPDTSLRRVVETPRVSPGPSGRAHVDRVHEMPPRSAASRSPAARRGRDRGASISVDPLQAGLIAEDEAQPLYDLYMRHFNTAMTILDAEHDSFHAVRARSSFLYTAILCIASRYINTQWCQSAYRPVTPLAPESPHSVHQQVLIMARDHMTRAFADATRTEDVLKAVLILSFWKEPDEAQAGYHFGQAVLLAHELGIGRVYSQAQLDRMTSRDLARIRARQRLWYNIFIINTIFHMQFGQRLLIDDMDPLVNTASNWLRHTTPSSLLIDTRLVYSVEIRRKYIAYRHSVQGPWSPSSPSMLSLAFTARRFNADWDSTVDAWERDLLQAGAAAPQMTKSRLYASSLKLSLNLVFVHQMRSAQSRERRREDPSLTTSAYHNAVQAALKTLDYLESFELAQVTFASDTLLHFFLYAASFLWAMCHDSNQAHVTTVEKPAVMHLINRSAAIFENASAYPTDSPAMHARYLRRLVQPPLQHRSRTQQPTAPAPQAFPSGSGLNGSSSSTALAALASAAQQPAQVDGLDPMAVANILSAPQQMTISPSALNLPQIDPMLGDFSFPDLPTNFDLDSFLNFPWHGDGTSGGGLPMNDWMG